jgi:hypothetical protein
MGNFLGSFASQQRKGSPTTAGVTPNPEGKNPAPCLLSYKGTRQTTNKKARIPEANNRDAGPYFFRFLKLFTRCPPFDLARVKSPHAGPGNPGLTAFQACSMILEHGMKQGTSMKRG